MAIFSDKQRGFHQRIDEELLATRRYEFIKEMPETRKRPESSSVQRRQETKGLKMRVQGYCISHELTRYLQNTSSKANCRLAAKISKL